MLPGISCLMPTTARRAWCIPLAVRWFQRQSYDGPLELVIVTEQPSKVSEACGPDPRIRIESCVEGTSLGEKHNQAASWAAHPWLAKWDDDDWQSPIRLDLTMRAARNASALMVSAEPRLFHELGGGNCYEYRYGLEGRWQAGNSLLFAREIWEARPFRTALTRCVDTAFVADQLDAGVDAVIVEDAPLTVVMRHGQRTGLTEWKPAPPDFRPWNGDLGGLLGADLALFEEAFCQKPAKATTLPASCPRRSPGEPTCPGPAGGSSTST